MKNANPLKISFGIIVINGEPFIRYNLESLYPHAHQILIVEGAVEKFRHAATSDGHSLDDTVNIIKSFPDPEKKIKLIQRDGFWPEKDEMSNAYMECCTGDYIWQVDVDEFYNTEDIEKVRSFLEDNPDVTRIDIQTINFWHGFSAVMQGASYCFGADRFRRIFKFRPGYRFLTHRPPTVIDSDGTICCDAKVVTGDELVKRLGVFMYHYSYVMQDYVKGKAEYYSKMNWGQGHEDGSRWVKDEWANLSNPLRVHMIKHPPSWIIPFELEHPTVIKRMINEIGYEEDPAVLKFLEGDYKKYQRVGEALISTILALKMGRGSRIKAAFATIGKLLPPTSCRNFRSNKTIIQTLLTIVKGA